MRESMPNWPSAGSIKLNQSGSKCQEGRFWAEPLICAVLPNFLLPAATFTFDWFFSVGKLCYTLAEGMRDGNIEVLAFDEKAGMVKVDDFGTITNLTFDKDGVKLTSSPPANSAPAPGAVPPPPGSPFGSIRTLPQRTLRLPGSVTPSAPQPSAQSGAGISSYGSRAGVAMSGGPSEASATLGGLLGQANAQPAGANGNAVDSADALAAAAQRTPEDTVTLYEANRLKNQMLQQQGAHLPRMPQHPYLGGQTPQPTPDPGAQQAPQ